MAGQRKQKGKKDLLVKLRARYKIMTEADQENRRLGLADIKFINVPGSQWDDNMKRERGERPCYEFNKLRVSVKRIINDIRANRPAGKVRGVEGGDTDTAEIYEGLIRNIWNTSDGDTCIDYAAEYQIGGGMGAWRIETEYSDDTAFDQDIVISPIKNPFCLYSDPAAQDVLKRDADDWILTEKISKKSFEERWPDAKPVNFEDTEFDDDEDWEDDATVRICEYWYKEPYDKTILLLTTGETVDATAPEAESITPDMIARSREVKCHRIMMCIASGSTILEGPVEWAGPDFPFVIVYGEYIVIDGKTLWWGLPRFAKDAQRSYNVSRTAITETIALTPKAKWWATVDQAKGLTSQWEEAHKKNYPYMIYNADAKVPGPPALMPGGDVPQALIEESMLASQEIRDVTGLHEASFGEESNEKSGIALERKQRQGAIVTYNYPDNMAKGIRRTWEILINLIPKVYDTERELRILGTDGAEDYKRVNQMVMGEDGQPQKLNDMARGRYDVTVTTGPSYATLRQESAETFSELASGFPPLMEVAGDIIFKNMDLPGAEDIADRLRAILPPPIQQMLQEGQELPPEAAAAIGQAQQAMMAVQEQTKLVQDAAQEVQGEKQEAEKMRLDVEKAINQLELKQVKFAADIQKQLADLALKEAGLTQKEEGLAEREEKFAQESQQAKEQEGESQAQSEVKSTLGEIDQLTSQFMEASQKEIADLRQMVAGMSNRPKVKSIRAKRENGELVATPEYEEAAQ